MALHDSFRKITLRLVPVLAVLALVLSQVSLAANIYRYKDASGNTVFSSFIPPELVKNGYEILNERGQVIQVVPPAPTEAELAARAAEEAERQRQQEAQRVQLEQDNLLRRLYRSPEDILRQRDDRLNQLAVQEAGIRANLEKAREDLEREQLAVENYERLGREVPAETQETLRIYRAELERVTAQQERLEQDRQAIIAEAERNHRRLSELLGLTEDTPAQ